MPVTAKRPAAAQLYLDWCLSEEGQAMLIRDLGHLTALKKSPADTPGLDPNVQQLWFANRNEPDRLRDPWLGGMGEGVWDAAVGSRWRIGRGDDAIATTLPRLRTPPPTSAAYDLPPILRG